MVFIIESDQGDDALHSKERLESAGEVFDLIRGLRLASDVDGTLEETRSALWREFFKLIESPFTLLSKLGFQAQASYQEFGMSSFGGVGLGEPDEIIEYTKCFEGRELVVNFRRSALQQPGDLRENVKIFYKGVSGLIAHSGPISPEDCISFILKTLLSEGLISTSDIEV